MKDLRHPAKSLYQNELNLEDEIIASEEDYHTWYSMLRDHFIDSKVNIVLHDREYVSIASVNMHPTRAKHKLV